MHSIGVDLHKKIITVCVLDERLRLVAQKTLYCQRPGEIVEFFRQFEQFQVVVEATASYQPFVELVEPLAEKIVLANPDDRAYEWRHPLDTGLVATSGRPGDPE
jgi:hypothetical protein